MSASVRLRVRVVPGRAPDAVVGRHGASWKLRISTAPERGRANEALLALLADTLAIGRNDTAVLAGHASRDKLVSLRGIEAGEVERRLERASLPAAGRRT